MNYKSEEIKKGIKIHCINTQKFKTNLIAVIMTVPLKRETVTNETLIPAVLKRGTVNLKSQEQISIKLEEMYGAIIDCGIEKIGDNHVIKFYLESICDDFITTQEKLIAKSIDLLLEVIFNPLVIKEKFKDEYVETEKNNIKQLIEGKIDNKDAYSLNRCIEEMYKEEPYGLHKYGYTEDLEKIDSQKLYKDYQKLIEESKIDIFISGNIDNNEISKIIKENANIKNLNDRETKLITNNVKGISKTNELPKTIEEKLDVNQGKLVIGLDVSQNKEDDRFPISIYNVILGESATSKLFQNVREKASLAYTIGSRYIRQKSNIFIKAGIEIDKYEEAVKIIKQQLEAMENGDFTEQDLNEAKKHIISGIVAVKDEQDSEITYYIGQELSGFFVSYEEYIEKINSVTINDVQNVAKNVKINTIYFLKGN